ncbi:hypothetical protein F8M41_003219 [Gigaspora margarita]|uniref:Uncharacterized protein n=1 Tax=Gigaspora margarita TaxID=4874 RepID=A0A8H3XBM4_GIGMA|nr:hypothetical protein F8M41_003219 [Gigaspora margarita]
MQINLHLELRFIGHQKILCEIINETTLTSLNTQSNSESNTHSNHTNNRQNNKSTTSNITSDQLRFNQLRATLDNVKGSGKSSTSNTQENFNEPTIDKLTTISLRQNQL